MTEFLKTTPATRVEIRDDGVWFIDPDGTERLGSFAMGTNTQVRMKLKPLDPRELARSFAGTAVDMLSRPSFRAGIVGSALTGAVCQRAGMRPVPALVLMFIAHSAAARLWEMAEDVHEAAVAQREHLAKLAADAGA